MGPPGAVGPGKNSQLSHPVSGPGPTQWAFAVARPSVDVYERHGVRACLRVACVLRACCVRAACILRVVCLRVCTCLRLRARVTLFVRVYFCSVAHEPA